MSEIIGFLIRTMSRVNLGYYLSETVLNKLVCQLELYTPCAYTCSAPAPNVVSFSHFQSKFMAEK